MARRQPSLSKLVSDGIPISAKVLVAVSGGKDSVVLLDLLLSSIRLTKVILEVVHVDHGLRKESAEDAQFVREIARLHGLPFHLSTLTPPSPASNLEAWGRKERYSFFEKVLSERELDWVVTAHTANDVAETLLMRLCANKGVGNILPIDERRRVLRPILKATRSQVDEYAASCNLTWREDSSNKETAFTRNKVRHEVLPALTKSFGESVVRTLSERGMGLHEDEVYLSLVALEQVRPLIPLIQSSPEWIRDAGVSFAALPDPLRWRAAEQILLPIVGYPVGPRRGALVADVLILARGRVELGGNLQVTATSEGVLLSNVGGADGEKGGVSEDPELFNQ